MTATVVLVTLLFAPAANGSAAAPAGCETFTRGTGTPPSLVRDWLAHSGDERVVMCPQPGAPASGGTTALYFGEGSLTQHGTVCTYPRHGLTLAGTGAAAHLQRYDRSEALAMALAGPGCPTPHAPTSAQGYVETYDISTSTFVGIMRLWSSIATAPAAAGGVQPAAAAARVQAALGSRTSEATVSRIVRIPGSALRHRYALFVRAPEKSGASSQYVVYVDKSLRGPYEIKAFTETN